MSYLQNNQYRDRFKGADYMQLKSIPNILLVGAGGIGNGVATKLLDLGYSFTIMDGDQVELHNCIPQGYNISNLGQKKVDAIITNYQNRFKVTIPLEQVHTVSEMFPCLGIIEPITISAVDSIEVRKEIFEKWREQEDRLLFLDGRMLAEFFQVFAITKENENWYYDKYLVSDAAQSADLEVGECTNQQNSFVAGILHGTIIQKLVNYLTDKPFSKLTTYNGLVDYIFVE